MAVSEDDVLDVLEQSVIDLAKKSAEQNASKYAEGFASAARQLAEARAWYLSAGQAHGGNGSQGD